jgi:RNA polymerase-binding transcription factor DksA
MTGPTPTPATTAALTPEQETEIRAMLAELRVANEADLRGAQEKLAALVAEGAMSDAALREVVAGAEYMVADASSILALIDAAEGRIQGGEYGLCSTCGAAIAWERLLLRPYRSTCVACS